MSQGTQIFHDGVLSDLKLRSATPTKTAVDAPTDTQTWEFAFDFVPANRGRTAVASFEQMLQALGLQYGAGKHAVEIKRQMLMVWNARGLADEQNVAGLVDDETTPFTKIAAIKAILSGSS